MKDERRRGAGRHDAQERLSDRCDLSDASLDFGPLVEENFDDRNTVVTLRLDVLDVVHGRGHGTLANRDEAFLHFLGRDAGKAPDHAHHGDVDLWKNVGSHARDRDNAREHDQNGHHREGVRPPQS